ncbi:DUF975 family protein [Novisyntrophococcus fermenticellae]|uniref:DUF975 family protein n=1 Tax=Novisyntrophococcus fermenticellae TaxID=2068655 RepID=UPI001E3A42F9|nr:DUF975 family protein [Novisyntrophococcus fermenticellae]
MEQSKQLKMDAREALIGNYGTYIAAYLIFTLINTCVYLFLYWFLMLAASRFSAIAGILVSFLFSILLNLLKIGLEKSALSISRHQSIGIGDLFFGLTHHPDRFLVIEFIKGIVYAVFTIIPAFVFTNYTFTKQGTDMLLQSSDVTDILSFALPYLGGFLLITGIGTLIASLLLMPLRLSTFLLMDDSGLSAMNALKKSASMMRGHMGSYFFLNYLSFLGLHLLNYVGSGLPMLWIYPYKQVTLSNFYNTLRSV